MFGEEKPEAQQADGAGMGVSQGRGGRRMPAGLGLELRAERPGKGQYLDSFRVLLIKGANVEGVCRIHLPSWGH